MNGTQKMIVALVAIFVAAGVVVGGFVVFGGSDESPSAATASYAPGAVPGDSSGYVAPPTVPAPAADNQQPVKLSRPTGVRASVTSGNTVLVQWNYPAANYVRYFQVFDDGMTVGGKTPPSQRRIFVTASYGTHCYRVLAVAVAGARSSNASGCGTVTVAKPYNPPPGSYNPPPGSYNPPPSGSNNPPPSG
jgi:hypothetical protein